MVTSPCSPYQPSSMGKYAHLKTNMTNWKLPIFMVDSQASHVSILGVTELFLFTSQICGFLA